MTEEERIFKGGLYASEEPELVEKKRKAHKLSQDYNTLYEEEQEAREKIFRSFWMLWEKAPLCLAPFIFTMGATHRLEATAL